MRRSTTQDAVVIRFSPTLTGLQITCCHDKHDLRRSFFHDVYCVGLRVTGNRPRASLFSEAETFLVS